MISMSSFSSLTTLLTALSLIQRLFVLNTLNFLTDMKSSSLFWGTCDWLIKVMWSKYWFVIGQYSPEPPPTVSAFLHTWSRFPPSHQLWSSLSPPSQTPYINQSEISFILCQPIRSEYLPCLRSNTFEEYQDQRWLQHCPCCWWNKTLFLHQQNYPGDHSQQMLRRSFHDQADTNCSCFHLSLNSFYTIKENFIFRQPKNICLTLPRASVCLC